MYTLKITVTHKTVKQETTNTQGVVHIRRSGGGGLWPGLKFDGQIFGNVTK